MALILGPTLEMLISLGRISRDTALEGVRHFMAEYETARQETNAVSAAHATHLSIDSNVKKDVLDSLKVTCRKGCSHCCYQLVEVSEHEALLLAGMLEEIKVRLDPTELLAESPRSFRPEEWSRYKCPLLKGGKCILYEYRPAVCRKYNVTSKSRFCNTKESQRVSRAASTQAELASTALLNSSEVGPLPHMLAEAIVKLESEQ